MAVLQCYDTAELGVIAYETPALEGMVINESVIVEIAKPGTGDPVPEGDVGEPPPEARRPVVVVLERHRPRRLVAPDHLEGEGMTHAVRPDHGRDPEGGDVPTRPGQAVDHGERDR